jgi:hypothetical protein
MGSQHTVILLYKFSYFAVQYVDNYVYRFLDDGSGFVSMY